MSLHKSVKELRPHPVNSEIYSDLADAELVESVRLNGVLQPILIDHCNRIISGHRRWDAAKKAGLEKVPVRILSSEDELELVTALLEANRQRSKTNEQVAREAACLFRVERQRAEHRRAQARLKEKDPAKSPEDIGEAREVTAKKLGIGAKKVEQAAALVEAIDRLKKKGRNGEAELLRTELNRFSMNRAYRMAAEKGFLHRACADHHAEDFSILIENWQTEAPEKRKHLLDQGGPACTFRRLNLEGLEWASWSWDPVTGCRHDCEYCTARDTAMERCSHGFKPVFYPGELRLPALTKVPSQKGGGGAERNVLTCWLADLFGDWVPAEIIQAVLGAIRGAPEWNFLLLTKNPRRLTEFQFPANAWVGATVDCQKRVAVTEKVFATIDVPVKWLMCAPLRTRLTFEQLNLFQWVVLGGADRSRRTSEFRPAREWVQHLWAQAEQARCKVYETTNLLERRREYPVLTAPK